MGGMELLSIGVNHVHDRHFRIVRPTGCGTWLLLLSRTPSWHWLEGRRQELPANTLLTYSPGCPQDYGALGEGYADDWMHFRLDSRDEALLERHPLVADTPLVLADSREIADLLRQLCFEFHADRPYRTESLELWFRLLVVRLHGCRQPVAVGPEGLRVPHSDKLLALRGMLRSGAWLDQSLDELAGSLAMSRSNLQHLYRRCFGTTIREEILQARLQLARHYLATTTMTVADVARYCGYQSESHFMNLFREKTGQTPAAWRASQ